MTSTPRHELVCRLRELGYFDQVSPLALDSLLDLALRYDLDEADEEPLYDRRTGRVALVDAEDLAEGYAEEIFRDLWPYLEERGVPRSEVSLKEMNGRDWRKVAIRFVALLSRLLEAAGSPDRAYLVYLGHTSLIVFLTPEMYQAIRSSPAAHPMFRPTSSDDGAGLSIFGGLRLLFHLLRMGLRR